MCVRCVSGCSRAWAQSTWSLSLHSSMCIRYGIRCWHGFLKWCTLSPNLMKTNILLHAFSFREFFLPSTLLSSSFWSPGNGNECRCLWRIRFVRIWIGVWWWNHLFFFFRIFIFISEWDHSNFAIKIVANDILLQMNSSLCSPNWLLCIRILSKQVHATITPQCGAASRHFDSGIHSNHVVIFIYYIVNEAYLSLSGVFFCSFSTFQHFLS